MTLINLNKLNNEQLEDHLYHLRNELYNEYRWMKDSTISKQWNAINRVKDILQRKKRGE
tara:strand:- start:210 stop:386 length:177 start_codon:yes stop_codon:yes gene_type:complete